jgi:serine/threonine protein kinase/tetratricopeptide (TPR) repeat protein
MGESAVTPEALALFERLLALPAPDHARELETLKRTRPDLYLQVAALVESDRSASAQGFLEDSAALAAGDTPAALAAGQMLGVYRLERRIGAGGMGEVWLGARADGRYQGQVAIKVLHPALARSALRERFLREGQILASLSHPHIARMLDAGAAEPGLLYLVLEHIDGERIDRWCEQRQLDVPAKLRLFLQVCDAVSHAHTRLVVHRDLKPSNILVTSAGQAKLLDFGIAKMLETSEAAADATELTRLGGRALTPEYAAPEQVCGKPITTATDVYSLGVILFALLSGQRPYGTPTSTPAQLEHDVTDTEPRRLSEVAPRERRKALRGDLDNIVAKALKKKPAERYASVQALADDLSRFLIFQPVSARPDSLGYRARKFLRRNRVGVAAGVTVALALVTGIAAALWQAQLAQAESTRAQAEAGRATATKNFLISLFRASDPRIASDRPRSAITAQELLDLGAVRIEKEFEGQPELQIELLGLTADIYESGLANEERYAALQKRRIELARAHYGPAHPIVLEGLLNEVIGAVYRLEFAKAGQLLDEVDALLRTSGQDRSILRAKWWGVKSGFIRESGGRYDDMHRALQESLALNEALAPNSSDHGFVLGMAARNHGRVGDYVQARRVSEQALAVIEAAPDRNDAYLPTLLMQHAAYLEQLGDFAGAERAYERAETMARRTIGERHGSYWEPRANHANLLHRRGERERAHRMFDEMLPTIPSDWKTGSHDYWARAAYADRLIAEGRPAEAIPLFEAGLRKFGRPYGGDGVIWMERLAFAYDGVGRTAEARGWLKAAVEEAFASLPEARLALIVRERWASFRLNHAQPGDADFAAAEAEFRTVLASVANRPWLEAARAQAGLARIAIARGDAGKALEQSRLALAALDGVQELYDVREQPQIWLVHSAALRATGDVAGARQWAQRALEASTRYDHPTAASIKRAKAALR